MLAADRDVRGGWFAWGPEPQGPPLCKWSRRPTVGLRLRPWSSVGVARAPRLPCPWSTHILGEEVALPSDGSEKRGVGGVVDFPAPTRCPPARHSVQVPRPHATGTESRPPWPSTYLAGRASPGTKVSWDQSRALTSMPPSTAESAHLGGHSEHLAGGSISTSGDKTGLPGCSGALRVSARKAKQACSSQSVCWERRASCMGSDPSAKEGKRSLSSPSFVSQDFKVTTRLFVFF